MLAVVKTPRIELSINGEGAREALDWLARKFSITVIGESSELVPVEETAFYREMAVNKAGNLLQAARIKAGLSQKQVAEAVGIRQTMVSEFETGRRKVTKTMAGRLAKVLDVKAERFA